MGCVPFVMMVDGWKRVLELDDCAGGVSQLRRAVVRVVAHQFAESRERLSVAEQVETLAFVFDSHMRHRLYDPA